MRRCCILAGMVLLSVVACGGKTSVIAGGEGVNKEQEMLDAIKSGSVEKVAAILSQDPSAVNHTNRAGQTPLHYATLTNHPDIVKLLLEHGADPKAKNDDGDTALSLAHSNSKTNSDLISLLEEAAHSK